MILSLITYQNIAEYRKSVEWVNHTNEVLKTTDEINVLLTQMQLQRRGYIVKFDNKYLAAYYENKNKLKDKFIELKSLIQNNLVQKMLVDQMDSLSAISILKLDSSLALFDVEKKVYPAQTDLAMSSQDNLDRIYLISQEIKKEEINLLNQRQSNAKISLVNTQMFIILTSLFAFGAIGLSLYISTKLIRNKNSAEKLLRKSYDELEDKVQERTSDLKTLNENLRTEVGSRIKVEKSLRESETRFRVMADSTPVLIWMSGTDKQFTYINKIWLDFTGRTQEEELGSGWTEMVHPDDLEKWLNTYSTSFDKRKNFEIECRLKNSKGDYRWIIVKGISRYEGNEFVGFIGGCIDIHDRKINERYLKIQYAVSKTLAESKNTEEIMDGVIEDICRAVEWDFGILWIVDDDKKFINVKSLWSPVLGTTQYSEMFSKYYKLEKGVGIPGTIWKEQRAQWYYDISKVENFPRKNSALKMGWNSVFAVPISNGQEVVAVIECFNRLKLLPKEDLLQVLEAVGRQIGNFLEKKKAEEKLQKSHTALEQRVTERTAELANTLNTLLKEIKEKEKIQNQLKLFAHAIKGIREGIFITDLDNKTLFVNAAFESIYGYLEDELIGKDITVIFSPDITEDVQEDIISNSLKGGWKGELKNKRKNGSEFHIYLSTTVIRNDEGKVQAIIGICQDITEMKYTQNELLEKQKMLEQSQKMTKLGSWEWDVKSNVVLWSDEMFSIYELEQGDFHPTFEGFLSRLHPDDVEQVKANIEKAFTTKEPIGFYERIITPSGQVKILRSHGEVITDEDGDVIKMIGACLDITDVKAAEERVKKSEKLLNAAQQIAKLGSWEVDMETGEVMWSEEMYRIFDFKEGDEKKNYEFMRKYIHRDDVQYMNSIIKILERKPQDMEIHYRIVTPDGRLKYLNSEIRIQHDENLKPIRIYGSTQDITEIKLVEDELRNANARLLQAQKELIHNEKLAALGRFSSGIAHEIRNPLANISALTQLLSKTKLDEKSEKHLKYILVNTDIANKIIVNLLNFASPEELILKQESVSEILNSMIESVEPRCIENKVKIGKCIPDNLPLLRIDRVKLENAFMNFISNAIDAMPEGGEINVEVKENKTENQLVIRISDTGSGIAKENLDKIFEPFFTTKEQGTGLGLGLAYQTVRLHFGIINISSEPGLGTIVEIKLPINELSINGKNINN